ncbi:MAG: hypothetical protein SFW08_02890 [Gemmatimonadaceae bacterium]|nr:hypothetical protein [Gemmatimonadaceae bacterium]
MATCPYTWVRNLLRPRQSDPGAPAQHLMVRVVRDGEERVRVALPARSARWLLEVIPPDVVRRIREEEIPIDSMAELLQRGDALYPGELFALRDANRDVAVWLE